MNAAADAPEARAVQAGRLYQAGDFQRAASSYQQAAASFREQGDKIKAAEMANNQAVALLQLDQAEAALEVLTGTPSIFKESGDLGKAAMAHGNLGQALAEANQPEAAKQHYQQALELFEQIGDQDSLKHTARALSQLQLKQGQAVQALFSMQRGVEGDRPTSLRDRLVRWLLRLPSRLLPH
jgi:tetratricopeptide (TPR) repeat protein